MPSISYNQNGISLREGWSAGRPVYTNSTSSSATSAGSAKSTTAGKDTISLSTDASLALTREKLGFSGRGKLSKNDMERQIYNDQNDVEDTLELVMEKLGITGKKVTLTRDDDGRIWVNEDFDEKENLESLLNEDEIFTGKFNRLSSNTELLNYTENVLTGSTKLSLASLLNGKTDINDWDSLFNIADRFKAMKKSSDPLAMVTDMSRKTVPFELIYPSR